MAKGAALIGREIDWSGWAVAVYLRQDIAVALVFGVILLLTRNPRVQWALYGIAVIYIGLNAVVVQILSTPLTLPMLRATGGALADSIRHYLTWPNALLFALVLGAGALLPRLLQRVPTRAVPVAAVLGLLLAGAGFIHARTVETAGLDRNAFFALIGSSWNRVPAQHAEADWRQSPFSRARSDPLHNLRAVAAGRNVILIVLESTGATHLKTYGAALDPMPTLHALASRAIVFEHAYAVYPESIKGLLPVLCSRYPAFDLTAEAHARITTPSIAQLLAQRGYRTGLFHSGRFIYLGMQSMIENRGFEVAEDAGQIGGNINSSFGVDEPATIARILQWIDGLQTDQPFFLTYLPIAGHHPYESPEPRPFPEMEEIDRYRNALFSGDKALGVFIDALQKRGLFEKTLFVIFGDHGEAFGQHEGNYGHTMFLYEENVRVPYLLMIPGMVTKQTRVRRPVSVIDTAATILDLLGLPIPESYQGASLLDDSERMALLLTDYSLRFTGLRDGAWKFIDEVGADRPKLFHLDQDPQERQNLAATYSERTVAYRELLTRWSRAQKNLIVNGK